MKLQHQSRRVTFTDVAYRSALVPDAPKKDVVLVVNVSSSSLRLCQAVPKPMFAFPSVSIELVVGTVALKSR
jgi:hypothetical protein